jgi:hypothetical protein
MKNVNTLVSSAVLSYLWKEKQYDNIDLLKPFVLCILDVNYKPNSGIVINSVLVANKLTEIFSFELIPIAILNKIFIRLVNNDKVLLRENKSFYLSKDLSEKTKSFYEKRSLATKDIDYVVSYFRDFLGKRGKIKKGTNKDEILQIVYSFLNKHGYSVLQNIKNLDGLRVSGDQEHYLLCQLIIDESKNESEFFRCFTRIIEGNMLSSAIYLQIENNIQSSLKKLNIYFDTPVLLSILGFKTDEQNQMASELIKILDKQKASLLCFKHNFDEVIYILENYKNNSDQFRFEKTLEYFDDNNFDSEDIDYVISTLTSKLVGHGIHISETPDVNEYEGSIDFDKMRKAIQDQYIKTTSEIVIDNDIKSINAISMLRKGKKFEKIEESIAVFVTSNYGLIKITNQFLEIQHYKEIGVAISDVDITTIAWQKSFSINPDLPKTKLLTNALSGFELPRNMLSKIKEITDKMELTGVDSGGDIVANMLITHTNSQELMEFTNGDPNQLSEDTILKILSKDLFKQIENEKTNNAKIQNENQSIIDENTRLKNDKNLYLMKSRNLATEKANRDFNILVKIAKFLIPLLFLMFIVIFVITTFNQINFSNNSISAYLNFIIIILFGCGSFYAFFCYISKITSQKLQDFRDFRAKHYMKYYDGIFKD